MSFTTPLRFHLCSQLKASSHLHQGHSARKLSIAMTTGKLLDFLPTASHWEDSSGCCA